MVDPATGRQVWQIGTGDAARSYASVFLEHGVALIGPGDAGPWRPGYPGANNTGIESFSTAVREGDILLLRTGRRNVKAIGLVAGGYVHLREFDDVNGWPLQHARRVRWYPLPRDHAFPADVFGANPRRFSRCFRAEVRDFAEAFVASPPTAWQHAPLPKLPAEEATLEAVPREIADLIAQAADLMALYQDGERFGSWPKEAETVAHFVVPLLRALGWAPELIGLECWRIDIAVFDRLPRSPATLRLIIEAKQPGRGIEGASGQARDYAKSLGVARDVVVTDGFRYRLHPAEAARPSAYANLTRLKRSALQLFDSMRPAFRGGENPDTVAT